jgi:hypothetical protein
MFPKTDVLRHRLVVVLPEHRLEQRDEESRDRYFATCDSIRRGR